MAQVVSESLKSSRSLHERVLRASFSLISKIRTLCVTVLYISGGRKAGRKHPPPPENRQHFEFFFTTRKKILCKVISNSLFLSLLKCFIYLFESKINFLITVIISFKENFRSCYPIIWPFSHQWKTWSVAQQGYCSRPVQEFGRIQENTRWKCDSGVYITAH